MIKEVREVTENEFDINNVADQPAENVTETAEPTAEAIAETIADINSDAAVAVAPIASASPKKAKKKKDEYRVSNFDIIKNFHRYTAKEKKHYRYLFWHRIAGYVWPFFRAVIIFGLSFVILYPILYMISTSIRPQSEMNDPSIMWIPKTIRLENFVEVWKATNYPSTLWNTLVLNVVSSVLQVGTCALTGYGFARFKFKGKNFFFALVLLQIIVPVQIILIPQYSQFRYFDIFGLFNALMGDSLNLVGTNFAMYIPALMCNGIRAGLFIYLFRQFFRGLPKELEQSAYIDGAGPLRAFWSIMLPNASNMMITVFLFSFTWQWTDTTYNAMLCPNLNILANVVLNVSSGVTDKVQAAAVEDTATLLVILPLLIVFLFAQRYFIQSIERSGLVE